MIATGNCIPELTQIERMILENEKENARDRGSAAATKARAAWEEKRKAEILFYGDPNDPETQELARQTVTDALENGVLSGNFVIQVQEGNRFSPVKVEEILAEPARYHEARCLDPLEPEYDGSRAVGIIYTCQPRPIVFSFARGGASYKLARVKHRVELVAGRESDAVKEVIGHLANEPMIFVFDNGLATVRNGKIHRLSEYTLKHFLSDVVQLYEYRTNRAGEKYVKELNLTDGFLKETLANATIYGLNVLDAVITAPILRLDGSVLDQPGYDEETRLFLALPPDANIRIPREPSISEINEALDILWAPIRDFPFVDGGARGAALAALLTAAVRAVLPTSPAFGYDAPTQGSGKSLLARTTAVVATGAVPREMPPTRCRDDEEYRKRLVPIVISGDRAFILDNVVGEFDSPSTAMFLTTLEFSDRELGFSKISKAVNRTLMLITGNNLRCTGDMARRVIPIRIDPGTENPTVRQFDFDPYAYALKNRLKMIEAALTIMRGRYTYLTDPTPGRLASFEEWDEMVRQSVVWVSRQIAPDRFTDPVDLLEKVQDSDPVREAEATLFFDLFDEFGDREFTAAEVLSPRCFQIHIALVELAGDGATKSARSIGKVLGYRQDRVRSGLKLVARKPSKKEALKFRIVEIDD